ncbi:helix-turn-helix domain-containing protein [Alkalihalobacterium bogoriense]|uniref:helix-turn-helix domain-containing protein n=1 Tax=Alkalihalobacterium bogoriense TaxID=246272 RepID=UPI00047DFA7A|nr:MerR family transcriptional regulator [Alkalihalobacterium bogoriense]
MHFTIQEFSKRTGLPPSKLRFYDKKGLLKPSTRLENGYRAYTPDQIHWAKMIDSLRQADIAISEIKQYSEVDEQAKKSLIESWKADLDQRMATLNAARKYVDGIQVNKAQTLLLSKWEKEKQIVWKQVEAERVPHPFQRFFLSSKEQLQSLGWNVSEYVFVKTDQITKEKIMGEIGFEVVGSLPPLDCDDIRVERFPPTLFAVMQNCKADDAFLCFSYIQVVIKYGFQPANIKFERYASIEAEQFDYLIPIVT